MNLLREATVSSPYRVRCCIAGYFQDLVEIRRLHKLQASRYRRTFVRNTVTGADAEGDLVG
jgi:hypothetical protein